MMSHPPLKSLMAHQTDHLRRLLDHLEWADSRVLESIRNARAPLPAVFSLYSHILGAEHTWISRINGSTPRVAVWPSLSLEECESLARENVRSIGNLIDSLQSTDLGKAINYRNSAGAEFTNPLEDILLHAFLHGSYHRGQVAALLRSGGDEPASTDYIVWLRTATGSASTKP